MDNGGRKIKKEEFARLLAKVLEKNLKIPTIVNSFGRTSLIDLDPSNVSFHSLIRTIWLLNNFPMLVQELKRKKSYATFIIWKQKL